MPGRKKPPVEANVDEQDDQEAAEAEVDALLESPERRRQEDFDEEDVDDDDSEDSELKRRRKEEAKLKQLMADAEKELAEKWAKATFWSELKAMIPGTKEYREEQAELREMSEENSISRIRRDLARCAAVERLLKKGEWERSLARMKREMKFEEYTDFQRAKADMEERGEWDPTAEVKYKPRPKHDGIFGALMKRLKPHAEEEEEEEEKEEDAAQKAAKKAEELAARREREGEGEHTKLLVDRAEANMTCTWRLKGKEDKWYACTNQKVAHITQTRIDIYGRTRPVFTAFCKFHMKTCYNDHGMRFVRVAEANELGLCNECYVRARDRPPKHVDPFTVPGVSREKRAKAEQTDTIAEDDDGLIGGKPRLCRWQPDRHSNEELKYTCTNPVFRNTIKHKFESFCAYHLPMCWETHGDPDPTKLLIKDPNVDGLCNSHFLLLHHRMPPVLRLPFPGMVIRKRRSHPMGPSDSPREHIVYRRPADDGRGPTSSRLRAGQPLARSLGATMKSAMTQWAHSPGIALHTLRQGLADVTVSTLDGLKRATRQRPLMQTLGAVMPPLLLRPSTADRPFTAKQVEAVLLFQRDLRMHLAKLLRKKLAARRKARARMAATLTLQAWGRARVQRHRYVAQIRLAHVSATRIQSAFRGFMVRKYWRLRRAARTITRALARHYGQGLHLSYQFLQHERWVERNWTLACITLQRVIRGFFARRELARRRAALAKRLRRVIKAQCYVRRWLAVMFVSQYKARLEAMWRSALLIQTFMRLVRFQKRCNRLFSAKEKAAKRIQQRVRLYLARRRARRERRKQEEMWQLWNPTYFTRSDLLPWLKRSAYGTVPSPPTTVDLRTDSWYSGLGKERDGFDAHVVRLLLTLDSASSAKSDVASQASVDSTFAFRDAFAQFDKASLGTISRPDFVAALTIMWERMGHDLQPDEARSLSDRFDVERDGHIRYRLFFFYALQHTRPCATHGRIVCGDCCYYGGCNKCIDPRTRCKCQQYCAAKKEAGGRASVLCTCGHGISAHQILPSVLKENATEGGGHKRLPVLSQTQLNACVRRLRHVVDQGPTLEAAGFNVLAPYKPEPRRLNSAESDAIRREKLEHRRRHRSPWRDETYDEWAVRMLEEEQGRPTTASFFFRGRELDDLWPMVQKERLYVPRPGVNADEPGAVESVNWRRPETPRGGAAMQPPGTKLLPYVKSMRTMQEEVGIVLGEGTLPLRQSYKELHYGFLITVPVPVIVRKELRLCKNPVALYLHLLSLFADPTSRLLDDERAYTHLIAHHCVFLERHWKKFIKDLQTGTLNEFIPLSPSQRAFLESRMAPNPKVAAKLERLLLRLGFHRRASGGMVQSQKKDHQPDALGGTKAAEVGKKAAEMVVRADPCKTYLFPEYASPFRLRTLTHKVQADPPRRQSAFHLNLTAPLTDPAVSGDGVTVGMRSRLGSPRPKSARSLRPSSIREGEGGGEGRGTQSARQGSPDNRLRGTLRPGKSRGALLRPGSVEHKPPGAKAQSQKGAVVTYQRLKRAGSVSDIDRQALPNSEILRLGYELIRKPFPVKDPILEQPQRRRRRHVCGHPGCGRAFTNREVAEAHLKAHDFCSRLGVAAPLSDQYMHRYWPAGVPWRGSPIIKRTLPLALYYCPLPNCPKNFGDLQLFMQHVRCGHSVRELRRFGVPSLSGVEWIGNARPVPPLEPPLRANVPVCTNVSHAHPHLRCAMCRAVQAFQGPRAPLRFFDKGRVTLDGNKDKAPLLLSFVDPETTACISETAHSLGHGKGSGNGSGSGSGGGSGFATARSGNTTARSNGKTSRAGSTLSLDSGGGGWAPGGEGGAGSSETLLLAAPSPTTSRVSATGPGGGHSVGSGSGSGSASQHSKCARVLVPVHCVGLCEDRDGKAWIGAARYLDATTLRQVHGLKRLPADFDKEHELMQSLEVEWLPLSRVRAYSYTLCCSRADFKQRRLEGSLPKHAPAKFARYVFSTATGQVVGTRTVAGDPYKTSGVEYTPPTMLLGATQGGGLGKTARFKGTKRGPSSLSASRANSGRSSLTPKDTFRGTVAFAATGGGEEAGEKLAEDGAEDLIDTRRNGTSLPPVT